ncbi:MAG: LacI family DNA-binding transcriptional regulator [Devosia sp.]
MKRGRRLSQADIAGRLGISVSTVSRALANEGGISPMVRQDVQQLARTLGYRSKRLGSGLIDRRALAFVPLGSATSGLSGFYFGIVEGMRTAALHSGVALDVRLINEAALSVDAIKRGAKEGAATGLLLAGIDATDELVSWCAGEELPVVLVNGSDPQMRLSSVSPANFYGAFAATRRLLDAGHRRILHFTHELRPTIAERRRGFMAAAQAAGAAATVMSNHEMPTAEFAARLVAGAYDVTGLFIWNDIVAVQVLETINQAGQTGRYSIVGFDDLPIASLATPRLSTMHVNREAIGEAAMRLLRQKMEGDRSVQQLELGVSAIEGGTIYPFI